MKLSHRTPEITCQPSRPREAEANVVSPTKDHFITSCTNLLHLIHQVHQDLGEKKTFLFEIMAWMWPSKADVKFPWSKNDAQRILNHHISSDRKIWKSMGYSHFLLYIQRSLPIGNWKRPSLFIWCVRKTMIVSRYMLVENWLSV